MTNLTKAIDQLQEVVKDLKEIYSASITMPNDGNVIQVQSRESELLEEARRRGYVEGVKFKALTDGGQRTLKGPLFINYGIVRDYTGSIIYDERLKEWAEIIPEQKEENPLCPTCHKYENINCSNSFHLSAKPLHDQIREGGWEKVIELVGRSYNYCCGTDECGTKVDAYIKLLALSKVLNEGKERGKYFFKVKVNEEGELYWVSNEICDQPIYFKDHMDIDFALDFAEKEWKIFYNSNQ